MDCNWLPFSQLNDFKVWRMSWGCSGIIFTTLVSQPWNNCSCASRKLINFVRNGLLNLFTHQSLKKWRRSLLFLKGGNYNCLELNLKLWSKINNSSTFATFSNYKNGFPWTCLDPGHCYFQASHIFWSKWFLKAQDDIKYLVSSCSFC